jgi:hypothetical protein
MRRGTLFRPLALVIGTKPNANERETRKNI